MTFSRPARWALRLAMLLGLAVIYVPLIVVVINSLNVSQTFGWPPRGFTLEWWHRALDSSGLRDALLSSLLVGLGATAIALVLGTPQEHDGILKLQDKTTCALTMGTYTANPNGTWRLSFDEVNGGGLCSRMADSTFTVKKGLLAEQLLVDATYSAENGTTTKRRIVLRHYP